MGTCFPLVHSPGNRNLLFKLQPMEITSPSGNTLSSRFLQQQSDWYLFVLLFMQADILSFGNKPENSTFQFLLVLDTAFRKVLFS